MAHLDYEMKDFPLNFFCVIKNQVFLYQTNCKVSSAQKNCLNRTKSVGNFPPLDFYYYITWILT